MFPRGGDMGAPVARAVDKVKGFRMSSNSSTDGAAANRLVRVRRRRQSYANEQQSSWLQRPRVNKRVAWQNDRMRLSDFAEYGAPVWVALIGLVLAFLAIGISRVARRIRERLIIHESRGRRRRGR